VVLFCFVFLRVVAVGAGPFSVDARARPAPRRRALVARPTEAAGGTIAPARLPRAALTVAEAAANRRADQHRPPT
jgi:hypothetical protein